MSLTAIQRAHFQEHGFVIAPHFFDARETLALRREIERLVREGKLRNVATEGDGKTRSTAKVNLQLCPMFNHSRLYRAVPFVPKVVEAVRALIGDPFILHLDQVFLKPGKHGMGTNWHQDNAYFKISDPTKGTAMWIAAHDATLANGTLHVIPDSHRTKYEHSRDGHSDHHIRCYPPEEQAVPAVIEAGGVVFFNYGCCHATKGNQTDHERAGLAFHFLRQDFAAKELLAADRATRPAITGPEATGGVREYGEQVAGAWEQEVARALAPIPALAKI